MSHPITKIAGLAMTAYLLAGAAHSLADREAIQHEETRLDAYYSQMLTPVATATPPIEQGRML